MLIPAAVAVDSAAPAKRKVPVDFVAVSDAAGDSDDEEDSTNAIPHQFMAKMCLAESAVLEITNECRLSITEEVRSKFSYLETQLFNESEKFVSLATEIDKKAELQHKRDRNFDLQYQQTLAESLHNHLSLVRHLIERRIRDDVAREEEAKRRETSIQQERMKADNEAKLKTEMAELSKEASENALELGKRRREAYEEWSAKIKAVEKSANQDYHKHGRSIGRLIKTASATIENISTRAEELVKLINNTDCPQSISTQIFIKKLISNCTNQMSSAAIFATCRVVVLVTFKIPLAMNILIAELNKVCMFTVPKLISYSKEAFKTKDDCFKAIGFKEENGKIESIDDYVERLSCYMKFYGALVQTEVEGFQNLHGLTEGWAWLAKFLNTLPANLFTAIALDSFLEMAGYTLYCRYKNQFEKLLCIIGRDFLDALEGGGESRSAKLSKVKMSIRNYIESKQYKKKPEGLQLRSHLDSHYFDPHYYW